MNLNRTQHGGRYGERYRGVDAADFSGDRRRPGGDGRRPSFESCAVSDRYDIGVVARPIYLICDI